MTIISAPPAELLGARGGTKEARALYAEASELAAKLLREGKIRSEPRDSWMLVPTRTVFGGCLRALGRFDEAEPLLLAAHAELKQRRSVRDYRARAAQRELVKLYEQWGKPAEAAKWRALDSRH